MNVAAPKMTDEPIIRKTRMMAIICCLSIRSFPRSRN
jgi:hypothetical protein